MHFLADAEPRFQFLHLSVVVVVVEYKRRERDPEGRNKLTEYTRHAAKVGGGKERLGERERNEKDP